MKMIVIYDMYTNNQKCTYIYIDQNKNIWHSTQIYSKKQQYLKLKHFTLRHRHQTFAGPSADGNGDFAKGEENQSD